MRIFTTCSVSLVSQLITCGVVTADDQNRATWGESRIDFGENNIQLNIIYHCLTLKISILPTPQVLHAALYISSAY